MKMDMWGRGLESELFGSSCMQGLVTVDLTPILVRAFGTEPHVRVTVESESLKAAKEIMKKGVTLVKRLVGEMEK